MLTEPLPLFVTKAQPVRPSTATATGTRPTRRTRRKRLVLSKRKRRTCRMRGKTRLHRGEDRAVARRLDAPRHGRKCGVNAARLASSTLPTTLMLAGVRVVPVVRDRCLAPPFISWYKRSSWLAVQSAYCRTQPGLNQDTGAMDTTKSAYVDQPPDGWAGEAGCPLPAQRQNRLVAASVGDAACEQDPTALA
jgi:hypothetical protein